MSKIKVLNSENILLLKHFPYLNGDSGLVVAVGGESLGLLGGDGGVPLDQAGHHTTGSLNTQRQGGDVEQKEVRHSLAGVSGQDSSLEKNSMYQNQL